MAIPTSPRLMSGLFQAPTFSSAWPKYLLLSHRSSMPSRRCVTFPCFPPLADWLFYQAPKRMKSVVTAFAQFQTAVFSALNFALVAVNVEPKFTWLFGSFAITAWVTGNIFFLTCVFLFFVIHSVDLHPNVGSASLIKWRFSSMLSGPANVWVSEMSM